MCYTAAVRKNQKSRFRTETTATGDDLFEDVQAGFSSVFADADTRILVKNYFPRATRQEPCFFHGLKSIIIGMSLEYLCFFFFTNGRYKRRTERNKKCCPQTVTKLNLKLLSNETAESHDFNNFHTGRRRW